MDILENIKNLTNQINIKESLSELQNNFLNSNIGQAVAEGVDSGIRFLLPDFIEEDIIDIKDAIVTKGFKEGINVAIDKAVETGKNIVGIFKGDFSNIEEIKEVLAKGDLLEKVSGVLDKAIDFAEDRKVITSGIANVLKSGKDMLINNIDESIETDFEEQLESIEKVEKYIEKWNKYYEEQDFTNMQRQYTKIQNELENIVPLEEVINEARYVENLHNLIKNNGKNFNLSENELNAAKLLAN